MSCALPRTSRVSTDARHHFDEGPFAMIEHVSEPHILGRAGVNDVPDPYRWLEDADDPATRRWCAAQDALIAAERMRWRSKATFLDDLFTLTSFDHSTPPTWCADRAFFTSREPDGEHPRLIVAEGGTTRVLFDPGCSVDGQARLGYWSPSPDARWLAYQVAADGSEEFTLRVMDVSSGTDIGEAVEGCRYSAMAWIPGADAFYYTYPRGRTERAGPRVYLHRLDSTVSADVEVFGSVLTESEDLCITVSPDGQLLIVSASVGFAADNQLWVGALTRKNLDHPEFVRLAVCEGGWTEVWAGRRGRLFLLTDADAPRGRLMVVDDVSRPEETVRCVVPEDHRMVLEGFAVLDEIGAAELLALWASDGLSVVARYDASSGASLGTVPLPGPGVVTELTFADGAGDEVWFTYSDRVTPETVYSHRRGDDHSVPWGRTGSIEVPDVVAATEHFRSADGTTVRLLLVGPASDPGHPVPTILQGYGAFGVAQVADYYAAALAWAQHGGLFAVACVRGGGEHGEDWHRAGMRENKQRGIEDFLGAAEHLITTGRTTPELLGAFGQSAGGLLVAAAMTQQPQVFAAVSTTAAPLDMARYELSGLGPHWTDEFGSRDNSVELGWLLGYSPYHHVRPDVEYPAVLLTVFEQDTRVDPLHGRKMCAALQAATCGRQPILLRREITVGHGERDRSGRLAYFSEVLAFFAWQLHMNDATA